MFCLSQWEESSHGNLLSEATSDAVRSRIDFITNVFHHSEEPLHYRDVFESLQREYTKEASSLGKTYGTLHSSGKFVALGHGFFGLREWQDDKELQNVDCLASIRNVEAAITDILREGKKPQNYSLIRDKLQAKLNLPRIPAFSVYIYMRRNPVYVLLSGGKFALQNWDLSDYQVLSGTSKQVRDRVQLFTRILQEQQRVLHCKDILALASDRLPDPVSINTVYATLHTNEAFTPLGRGVFGLSSWQHPRYRVFGMERVFDTCPAPLLGTYGKSKGILESVVIGLKLLKDEPYWTADEFLHRVVLEANLEDCDPQDVFDTWYITGLIDLVDYNIEPKTPIELRLRDANSIHETRSACIPHIQTRLRFSTQILSIVKFAYPSYTQNITKITRQLNENVVFVDYILQYWEAFDVVRRHGLLWRLTPLGETILQSFPPQELPNFSKIEHDLTVADDDELTWEDELGLLDL